MNKFEEDFQELWKEKRHQVRIPFLDGNTIITHAREEVHIEEHCRSVSKIIEVIDKVIPPDENCATNMILNMTLKKELGVEGKEDKE